MATADGNVQDISVEDKEHPALGATREAQDMSVLNKIVTPPPSFTNPNNPVTAAGSINLDLDKHPMELSPDYGKSGLEAAGVERDVVVGPMDEHSLTMAEAAEAGSAGVRAGGSGTPGAAERAAATRMMEYPDNRDEWLKGHWQGKAREYGLAVSGNTDAVKERVEEYEKGVENAKSLNAGGWTDLLNDVETQDDLDELRSLYERSGADFPSVVKAMDAKAEELNK